MPGGPLAHYLWSYPIHNICTHHKLPFRSGPCNRTVAAPGTATAGIRVSAGVSTLFSESSSDFLYKSEGNKYSERVVAIVHRIVVFVSRHRVQEENGSRVGRLCQALYNTTLGTEYRYASSCSTMRPEAGVGISREIARNSTGQCSAGSNEPNETSSIARIILRSMRSFVALAKIRGNQVCGP